MASVRRVVLVPLLFVSGVRRGVSCQDRRVASWPGRCAVFCSVLAWMCGLLTGSEGCLLVAVVPGKGAASRDKASRLVILHGRGPLARAAALALVDLGSCECSSSLAGAHRSLCNRFACGSTARCVRPVCFFFFFFLILMTRCLRVFPSLRREHMVCLCLKCATTTGLVQRHSSHADRAQRASCRSLTCNFGLMLAPVAVRGS